MCFTTGSEGMPWVNRIPSRVGCRSESERNPELEPSWIELRRGFPERTVRQVAVDPLQVNVIENIEVVEAQLQGQPFEKRSVLREADVPVVVARDSEGIRMLIPFAAECRSREVACREQTVQERAAARRLRIAYDVGKIVVEPVRIEVATAGRQSDNLAAGVQGRLERGSRVHDERCAALINGDTAEDPSIRERASESIAVMQSRDVVGIGERESIWGVPDRRAVVLIECRERRIDLRVILGARPRIRGIEISTTTEMSTDGGYERVVSALCGVLRVGNGSEAGVEAGGCRVVRDQIASEAV